TMVSWQRVHIFSLVTTTPLSRFTLFPYTTLFRSPKGQKELLAKYTSAFPDTKFTLGDLIGDGDLVAVRWTVRGTATKSPSPIKSDRKSTRLNSSHGSISYAVFCLKKKTKKDK